MFKRLLSRGGKYAIVGFATFLLDLGILAVLTRYTDIAYPISIAIGFLMAVSVNFVISYYWVYAGTKRRFHHSYAFFICLALGGAVVISVGTSLLVEVGGLPILLSRVMIGGVVGITNFFLNTFFNFRML